MILKILLATALIASLALVSCDSKSSEARGEPTATAIVQINRTNLFNQTPQPDNFIATEAAIITSPLTLELAAENSGLSAEELAGAIHCEQIDDTDLVTISTYQQNEAAAAKTIGAVVNAYVVRKTEEGKKLRRITLEALDLELQDLGDEVYDKQKALTILVQQYCIAIHPPLDPKDKEQIEEERHQTVQERLETLEHDRDRLKLYLSKLSDSPANLFFPRARSGIEIPENQLSLIYDQYLSVKRELNYLETEGLGPSHPRSVSLAKRAGELLVDFRSSVELLVQALEVRLSLIENQIARMTEVSGKSGTQDTNYDIPQHDYNLAKGEYEEGRDLLKKAKLQQQEMRALLRMPLTPLTVHKEAGK